MRGEREEGKGVGEKIEKREGRREGREKRGAGAKREREREKGRIEKGQTYYSVQNEILLFFSEGLITN